MMQMARGVAVKSLPHVPDGKILLISGEDDNKGEQGCLSSSVQNLADIGWENKIQWALLTTGSCPTPEPPPSSAPGS